MKKKVLCMLLVVMLSGAMLAGCGNNNDIPDKEVLAQSDETDTQPQETDEPETEEPTEQPALPTEEPTTPQTEEVTPEPTEEVPPQPQFTFTDLEQVMYAKSSVNVRNLPSTDGTKLGGLSTNQEVAVTGQCNETGWYRISYNSDEAFVSDKYLVTEKVVTQPVETVSQSGGEVAQQPVEETPEEAPAENPYPLYTVIDEGGTNVYFYFLFDGTAAKPEAYWTCFDQCTNILNERNGISRQADGWYSGAGSQETNYYVDGKQVVKALPVTGISVE